MQVYNKVTIDVKRKFNDIITAKQNDTKSRYLDVILVDNGVILDLTGHEVRIYGRKADGKEFYNEGIITDSKKGRCQFELTTQALALAQDLSVEIVIFKDNTEILSTLPFTIHVVKSLMSDNTVESSNEYGALVLLYQNLYEAYALMTEMVEKIGTPGEKAQELNLNTMFQVWDWLVEYMEENSTANVVNTVNGIDSKIGTSEDSKTDTVFGKLKDITKKCQKTVAIPSDNIKYKLLENANIRIDHTRGETTSKKIVLGIPEIQIPKGAFKAKINYSVKFNTSYSSNYFSVGLYTYGFDESNLTLTREIIDKQPIGTIINDSGGNITNSATSIYSGSKYVSGTDIVEQNVDGLAKICDGFCMELFLYVHASTSVENGYIIIKNVSICYDELEV